MPVVQKEDVYKGVQTHVGPTCHSPGCLGYGNLSSSIVFIGIAPGRDEVKTGKPLTGPSGQIFNNVLKGLGLGFTREDVYCTNLICWWKDDPSPEEAMRCAPRLKQELLEIKPKLIVLLGKIVAEIFTGRPFGKVRGNVSWSEEYNCYVLVTNHPAALLHALTNRASKGKDDTTIYDVIRDLRKIPEVLTWGPEAPLAQIRYRVVKSVEQAQNVLDNLPRSYDWPIAIDVETLYDKDDDEEFDVITDKLLCVGVGTDNFCWVFTPEALYNVLVDDEGVSKQVPALNWPKDLWYTMHYANFDAQIMKQELDVWIDVKEDTMLQSYSLDERSGIHRLKTLAREYLAAGFWEEAGRESTKKRGPLSELPKDKLYLYNAHDVVYTARLCYKFREMQIADNVRAHYERILIPAVNMYKEVSYHGVYIDQKLQDVLGLLWTEEWLERDKYLQEYAAEIGWPNGINFNSSQQLGKFIFTYLGLPIKKYTDKGQPSTDKDVLDELAEDNEFVEELVAFRRLTKMLGTYIFKLKKLIRKDNRAHPKVKLHSSVNGRPSFTDPALQTIPASYQHQASFGHLRELFCATRPDDNNRFTLLEDDPYVMIEADYGKAEIWMAYTYSRDPQMYADLTSGDYHSTVAADVMSKPVSDVTKQDRVNMKRVTFGIMYWREALSLSKKNGGINSTVRQAQEYIDKFFRRNKIYKKWFDDTAKLIIKTGELVTLTGRKRRITILGNQNRALKQAVNFPIQATANDVLLDAAIEIHPKLKAIGWHIVLTVHDSILSEGLQSRKEEAYKIIHDAMTAKRFPGIVQIPVELKLCDSWGKGKEVHDCSKGEDGNVWGGGFCLWNDPAAKTEAVA